MKTTQVDFRFPLIGFTSDADIWGFPDRNALTVCGPRTLRGRTPIGMQLVDAEGRRWVVRDMWRLGRDQPLLRWLVSTILTAVPGSRIDYELETMEPLSLAEVKGRFRAGIEAHPLYFSVSGDPETDIPALLADVEAASSITALYEVYGLDWFAAY